MWAGHHALGRTGLGLVQHVVGRKCAEKEFKFSFASNSSLFPTPVNVLQDTSFS